MSTQGFRIEPIDYARQVDDLRAVRETVFVQEQQVPLEEEWDELDALSQHLIARDETGLPIGTGRLTPQHRIGRMAVLADWRGRGVGEALLRALVELARQQGWEEVSLNAQVSAQVFYTREGFVPQGARFMEAGIEHQSMRRNLSGPTPVTDVAGAVASTIAVIAQARRSLCVHSQALDPDVFDDPAVLETLRRFAVRPGMKQARIVLQDPSTPQHAHAPLLALAQRLPSVFAFRVTQEPVDQANTAAWIVNDTGGYYYRLLGDRHAGETQLSAIARARKIADEFEQIWERSRPCTEYRALGI